MSRSWIAALLVLPLALACQRSPRKVDHDAAAADPAPLPTPVETEARVGRLMLNSLKSDHRPQDYCVDGRLYQGAPARVGRINVFGVAVADQLHFKTVIVRGVSEPSLFASLKEVGPCPEGVEPLPMQMRSDWMADEGGYKNTRERLSKTPAFRATRIEPISLHEELMRDDKKVIVRIKNPFASELKGELSIHYEGGPGKPMAHYDKQPLVIAPGGHVDLPMSLARSPGVRDNWELTSADIVASAGPVQIDVSLGL